MNNIFTLQVFVILIALIIGFLFGRHRRTKVENRGEAAIRKLLTKYFTGASYHLLNNITLPFEDGTTQIDHILISQYGIFVIETKHYSGWIFADATHQTWTQVIYHFKQKFQNPLRQNFKHLAAVRKELDFIPPENIHSLVVFTGNAEFRTKRPLGVFDIKELMTHIGQFSTEVMSENRLQFCVGRLECHRKIISGKTDAEHLAYLNRMHGDAN